MQKPFLACLAENQIRMWKAFLAYYARARADRKLGQPWVEALAARVLDDSRHFYAFDQVEQLRGRLLRSEERLQVQDLGAGSRLGLGSERKLAQLARYSASSPRQGRWLFKLIDWLAPERGLELGTSLGLGTYYQAAALPPNGHLHSIEGCPNIAAQAAKNLRHLGQLSLYQGDFGMVLPSLLPEIGPLDYVFMDGNHRLQASLDYFEQLLPYLAPQALVVLDDLHWSGEMSQAWQQLKAHPAVQLSVDVWEFGLLRLGPSLPAKSRDWTICPKSWKPYRVLA